MSDNTARKTSTATTKKESTMRKSTAKIETNEQRVARLNRAATGTKHIAEKALTALAKGVEEHISPSRVDGLVAKAEVAMRNANEAARAIGEPLPYRAVKATITRTIKQNTPVAPKPKPEPKATPKRQPRARKITLHAVETLNRADGSVDGHIAGCADIAKVAKRERIDRSGVIQVSSKHAAWLNYNSDFIAEHEHDGCDIDAGECGNAYIITWLPCADAVPEFDTAAAKPARKAASKPAPQPVPAGKDAKANALVQYLQDAGWSPTIETNDRGQTVVTGAREGETLQAHFIDGRMDTNPMPSYTRTDGSVVKLRNVSALRKQADSDPTARPVKAQRAVVVRKREEAHEDSTALDRSRALPVDELTADVESLNECLSGRTVAWRRTIDRTRETAIVLKVLRVYPCKTDGRMLVEFLEGMPSKHGLKAATTRTVAISKMTYA